MAAISLTSDNSKAADGFRLTPARAALAAAIENLASAQEQLEEAHRPLAELEEARTRPQSREAAELRVAFVELLNAHDAEIAVWARGGGPGPKPAPPAALVDAERRLNAIAATASVAEARRSAAQDAYLAAAEAARRAAAVRDRAVWPAALEAAATDLAELRAAIAAALASEARLRGLVKALREAGARMPAGSCDAMAAAEKLERAIGGLRPPAIRPWDLGPSRALLERLRSDPAAALCGNRA